MNELSLKRMAALSSRRMDRWVVSVMWVIRVFLLGGWLPYCIKHHIAYHVTIRCDITLTCHHRWNPYCLTLITSSHIAKLSNCHIQHCHIATLPYYHIAILPLLSYSRFSTMESSAWCRSAIWAGEDLRWIIISTVLRLLYTSPHPRIQSIHPTFSTTVPHLSLTYYDH